MAQDHLLPEYFTRQEQQKRCIGENSISNHRYVNNQSIIRRDIASTIMKSITRELHKVGFMTILWSSNNAVDSKQRDIANTFTKLMTRGAT